MAAFKDGDRALTLAELASRTGLYKSTILRLIGSLEAARFLHRGDDGRYRLGSELWRLGSLFGRSFSLEEQIRLHLQALVAATSETASYYVRDGDERVCLYRLNSPRPVRHHLEEGIRLPLHCGAAGRVLLAFGGEKGRIYDRIRRERHYISKGERDPEIGAAAVPVLSPTGDIRGALTISALLSRFDGHAQRLALEALLSSAATLTDHGR